MKNEHLQSSTIPSRIPDRIFVTGTNTNIGKTVVAAILVSGLKARYWKPIQSGISEPPDAPTDSIWISSKLRLNSDRIIDESYVLQMPASPHLSAKNEGRQISLQKILQDFQKIHSREPLIVEGAGGVLVPINEDELLIDLIKALNIPVLVVAGAKLGTINHTLLTIEALANRSIPILGIVINGERNSPVKNSIEFYSRVPVLAEIPDLISINELSLATAFRDCFGPLNAYQST
ncbi:MAG: dethiobiotin synthase [Candidatus Melainabacteria bacterium]|nr:dethiobiotin synthase [Candidatus Melainabacteria bacterium]